MIETKRMLHADNSASWLLTGKSFPTPSGRAWRLIPSKVFQAVAVLIVLASQSASAISRQDQTQTEKALESSSNEAAKEPTKDEVKEPTKGEESPSKKSGPLTAIINAKIYTMSGPVIERGRILVRGESIESVGDESLAIPEGTTTIDATGLSITPGWIDVNSQLWMSDSPGDAGSSDGSLLATDSLDPFAEDWADVLNSGVTTVYVQPSSSGAMSGLGAAVSVLPLPQGKLHVVNPMAGLQMSFGNSASNRDRATRFESIKRTLQSVVDYKKKWDDYDKAIKEEATKSTDTSKPAAAPNPAEPAQRPSAEGAGRSRRGREMPSEDRRPVPNPPGGTEIPAPSGGTPAPSGNDKPEAAKGAAAATASTPAKEAPKKPVKPEKDLVKERLVGVLVGKIPVRLEVRNANDVRYATELKKSFPDVQWVWEGLDQLGSALEETKRMGAPVVVGPFLNLGIPTKDATKRNDQLASFLDGYPGAVVVQSKSNLRNGSRLLREQLASAQSTGLNGEMLLKSVTVDAARLIGCEKQIGAIAAGMKADFVGFAGDPLDTRSSIALIVINGTVHKNIKLEGGDATASSASSHAAATSIASLSEKVTLQSTRMLLRDGVAKGMLALDSGKVVKIAAIGTDGSTAEAIADEKMVDLGHAFVTPGIVSVYSTFGLDGNARGTDSDSSHLTTSDLSLSDQRNNKRMEATGLYRVVLTTSSANTLAGQLSLFSTSLNKEDVVGQIGSKIVLSGEARSLDRFPSSLAGQVKFVRDTLDGKRSPSRLFVPDATLTSIDKAKEAVVGRWKDRSQIVVFQVSDDAEIEAAIRIVRDYKLRAAFVGSTNWSIYSEQLKELDIAVVVLPIKEGDYPVYIDDAVACHKAGVDVYFGGETGVQIRATASLAVRHGMDPHWARFAITYGHTKLFSDCESKSGLSEGESADFLIWSDDPLNLASKILARVRNGKVIVNEENP